MPKTKIAISLDSHLVASMKRMVADGYAPSVSAFIEDALQNHVVGDDEAFAADLAEALEATGGPLTAGEIADIDQRFGWA